MFYSHKRDRKNYLNLIWRKTFLKVNKIKFKFVAISKNENRKRMPHTFCKFKIFFFYFLQIIIFNVFFPLYFIFSRIIQLFKILFNKSAVYIRHLLRKCHFFRLFCLTFFTYLRLALLTIGVWFILF